MLGAGGFWFGVGGVGFRDVSGWMFRVWGCGLRVWGLGGLGIWGFVFRCGASGFLVQGLGVWRYGGLGFGLSGFLWFRAPGLLRTASKKGNLFWECP